MASKGHHKSIGHDEDKMSDRPGVKSLQLRLPTDLKDWIAVQADKNASSQNSEIVRSVRERMERQEAATA